MLEIKTTASEATKRKRSNKNKKKNWRKNIDISDIEKALEDERLELRTGGLVSEKPDDELFFLDKNANQEKVSKTQRKSKRLRVEEIIVPDPNSVKSAAKVRRRVKRRANKVLEKKLDRKVRDLKNTSAEESKEMPLIDLWKSESQDLYDKETKKNTITRYTEFITGERQVKRPKHLMNDPSDVVGYKFRHLPAVEVAHPGASYNPTYDDHQDLLAKAHSVEVGKEKAHEKIERALHVPFDQLPNPDTHEIEMQEGLFEEEEVEEAVEDPTETVQNPPVRAGDRKTRRRRKREEKEEQERRDKEKIWANKLRENEVFRTKTFLAEIREKEKKNIARRERRKNRTRMMTLSNVKFTDQDIELKLSDEIKGSLRELKPEGGLLTDRYKSFQKRGVVEPRCKRNVPKRKRKVKYQEKRPWREIEA